VTPDVRGYARRERLVEDLGGRLLLLELDSTAHELLSDLLAFAYGDARSSSLAADRIRALQAAL